MSNTDQNQKPSFTNPLQNNTTALAIVGYIAGIVAAKVPIFDLATWNYIFMTMGGIAIAGYQFYLTRKTTVIATTANMPEVNKIELDKSAVGVASLDASTPNNVVAR